LLGGDEERGHDQDDEGGLVVQPEDIVVDADRVELDEALHRAENIKHFSFSPKFQMNQKKIPFVRTAMSV